MSSIPVFPKNFDNQFFTEFRDKEVEPQTLFIFLLKILLIVLFFQGGIQTYIGINPKILYIPLIILCFLQSPSVIFDRNSLCLVGYLGFILMSFSCNYVSMDEFLFYFPRYYLDIVLVILCCLMLNRYQFTRNEGVKLVRLLIKLWIIQIIAAAVYVFLMGARIEGVCGVMSRSGGGLATLASCAMFSFFLVFGFATSKKWFFLAIAVPLLGYASQKRGIFFLVPLCCLCTVILMAFFQKKLYGNGKEGTKKFKSRLHLLLLGILLSGPVILYALQTTHFSASFEDWGEITYRNMFEFLDAAFENNQSQAVAGDASNDRYHSALLVVQIASSNLKYFCFGIHPLSAIVFVESDALGNENLATYGIEYGLSGTTTDIFSGGFFAAALILFMFISSVVTLLKVDVSKWEENWRCFPVATAAFGISGIIIYFCYGQDFLIRLPVLLCYLVFWYLATQKKAIFIKKQAKSDE